MTPLLPRDASPMCVRAASDAGIAVSTRHRKPGEKALAPKTRQDPIERESSSCPAARVRRRSSAAVKRPLSRGGEATRPVQASSRARASQNRAIRESVTAPSVHWRRMRILYVGDDFAALRPCGLTLYADALMRSQAARGHQVSYVFSGRHYPGLTRPRLKRWTTQDGILMHELIGSPLQSHWEAGTRYPERDLAEPAGEAAFTAAVREARPDVVHIQELARLPSSVIEQAKALGLPVVMTLHDYKPVCAAVRLLDADGQRCLKHEVGADCARNCASAPAGAAHLVDWTMNYERRRLKRALPVVKRLDFSRLAPLVRAGERAWHDKASDETCTASDSVESLPAGYQHRRDTNVARLNMCDRLIAPSARVAEIYAALGVEPSRLRVQRLALPHLERLHPRRGPELHAPTRFLTLGACASYAKGSRGRARSRAAARARRERRRLPSPRAGTRRATRR